METWVTMFPLSRKKRNEKENAKKSLTGTIVGTETGKETGNELSLNIFYPLGKGGENMM